MPQLVRKLLCDCDGAGVSDLLGDELSPESSLVQPMPNRREEEIQTKRSAERFIKPAYNLSFQALRLSECLRMLSPYPLTRSICFSKKTLNFVMVMRIPRGSVMALSEVHPGPEITIGSRPAR